MNRMTWIIVKGSYLALAALFMLGCTQPESSDPAVKASRILIKFVDTSRPPPDAFQVRMSDGSRVLLRHERVMSGETHLYNGRMNKAQLATIVRELNQRTDVQYAEADRQFHY